MFAVDLVPGSSLRSRSPRASPWLTVLTTYVNLDQSGLHGEHGGRLEGVMLAFSIPKSVDPLRLNCNHVEAEGVAMEG